MEIWADTDFVSSLIWKILEGYEKLPLAFVLKTLIENKIIGNKNSMITTVKR